ncbi:ATP-binding protein [Vibrio sp. WXL103]|uniref:hybrid sensor histidine kinase/response regulator n=1 Tax=Vibrio sp. WXL103 TaxID=3450710 RepID=UPI003EC739A9
MKIRKFIFYNSILVVILLLSAGAGAWSYYKLRLFDSNLVVVNELGHRLVDINSEFLAFQIQPQAAASQLTHTLNQFDIDIETLNLDSSQAIPLAALNQQDERYRQAFYSKSKYIVSRLEQLIRVEVALQFVQKAMPNSLAQNVDNYSKQQLVDVIIDLLSSDGVKPSEERSAPLSIYADNYYNLVVDQQQIVGELLTADNFAYIHITENYYINRINQSLLGMIIGGVIAIICAGILFYRYLYRSYVREQRSNQQLEIAREQAEAASEAKSLFLATMSHELRTPMNGVLGMAQVLSSQITNPQQREMLSTIVDSGTHFVTILNDILDFSKSDKDKIEFAKEPFFLTELINPIVATYKPICDAKGIRLVVNNSVDPDIELLGDESRLRQVIYNLVSNAAKFTHQGEVVFNLSLDADHLKVEVIDTGVGIPLRSQPTIFDPFVQSDSSISREYGGTGLGLAIVDKMVEGMNGTKGFDSDEGEGSHFWVSIPIESRVAAAKQPTLDSQRVVQEESGTLHILIAEDNKVNAMVAKKLCKDLGYTSEVAVDGEKAVELVKQRSFDLILMDHHMPNMTGLEATKVILGELKLAIPIIVCTADGFEETKQQFIQAGATDYIHKPIKKDRLAESIGGIKVLQQLN